jgi:hypothetical protein
VSFDTHAFGGYLVTDPDNGRLPYGFTWQYPRPTSGYREHLRAGLRAETYADEMWELPTHTLTVGWFGLTDLPGAVNDALNAIIPGARWYVTPAGSATTYSTLVRDVEHSEAYSVDVDGRRGTAIDFTLTCTPGWERTEVEVPLDPPDTVPTVYRATGILGSMPAAFRLALTFDQATTGLDLGFKHRDPDTLTLVQDYDGTGDAAALGGEYAGATMTAGGIAVGTPDTLDTNVHRGWWLPVARMKQPDATPGDTTYVARSTVSAFLLGTSESVDSEPVAASVQNAYEYVRLGPVPIPAAPVPDDISPSGWLPYSVGNTVDAGTLTLKPAVIGFQYVLIAYQTFPTFTGRIARVRYEVDVAPTPTLTAPGTKLEIRDGSGSIISQVPLTSADFTVGEHTITLPTPIDTETGSTYSIWLFVYAASTFTIGFAYSNGDYADGQLTVDVGMGASAGDDLTFAVLGEVPIEFASSVGIIATNSGGGTARNDVTALVPADEYALLADVTTAADEGLLLDAIDPDEVTCYVTNTDGGIGAADQNAVEHIGRPRLWPGDTAIVCVAHTPGDAAPTGGDGKLWYRPRYKTPYGG